jgi:ferredoxin-type protein NapF
MKLYRYRRYFQTFFLVLFFAFLTLTIWPLGAVYLGAFLLADPLIALNSLAGAIWKWEMLLAVFFLILTFFLGRAFCGYVCPFGFIIELLGPKDQKLAKSKVREFLLKLPVHILIVSAGLLLFGSTLYLVLDPLALLTRTSATVLYPLLDIVARLTGDVLYLIGPLRGTVDFLTNLLSGIIIFQKPLSYQLQFAIFAMFLLIIGLSFWVRRMWCRHLCPLGALLGLTSRFSLWGRVVDESKCIKCLKCESACPIDAVRCEGLSTDKSRCELSFECADACPTNAVHFGLKPKTEVYNPGRRAFLTVAGITILSGAFLHTSVSRREKNQSLVRPPGSQEENNFLALCSRCGQCMKVCPTNVLQPSLFAAGPEGLFTPQMNFDLGYCDWACNECTKVCPTGAIIHLPLSRKRKFKAGRAYIDRNRCIPWADSKNCLVCEELCPLPAKAILFKEQRVLTPKKELVIVKQPQVIADRCIGCGICEFNCPVPYHSAITVRAVRG